MCVHDSSGSKDLLSNGPGGGEEKKKWGEQCRKRVKQVNRKGKGKRKRWQRANESLKEGNREGRQRKRERGAEFPPCGINTARWSRAQ